MKHAGWRGGIALLGMLLAGCAGLGRLPEIPGQADTAAITPAGEALPASAAGLATLSATPSITDTPPPPSETPAPSITDTPTLIFTPTQTPYALGPDQFPAGINRLTGLAAKEPGLLERRPILVKITNYPRTVRPQWGLTRADHVLEYYIADEFTRFVAVFYGENASRVGPVRSGRLFDAHAMRLYNGIFVFGWADDAVLNFLLQPDLRNLLVVERPGNCPPLCRIGSPDAYNTLFADTSQIGDYLRDNRVDNDAPDLSGMRFEMAAPGSGSQAGSLEIRYSIVAYLRWQYEPALGVYLREQDDQDALGGSYGFTPLIDSLTQEQITADNVLVLFVAHQFYRKSTSTEIIDQALAGEGRGYAFRDGRIYPVTWHAETPNALPRFTLPDGRDYAFKPGNTWFEIIGETSEFGETRAGEWGFSFRTP